MEGFALDNMDTSSDEDDQGEDQFVGAVTLGQEQLKIITEAIEQQDHPKDEKETPEASESV